jgi:hypothetical protein
MLPPACQAPAAGPRERQSRPQARATIDAVSARPHLPPEMRAFFWDVDYDALDLETHADAILARVLEYGRLVDVRWALATYGPERIRAFFREVAHPLISDKTRTFWRAYFRAEEPWATPPAWRKSSAVPWLD